MSAVGGDARSCAPSHEAMIELDDAEVFAARELRLARLDGHPTPDWQIVIQRRGILVATFGKDSPVRGAGTHGTVRGQPVVYVNRALTTRAMAFVGLHEYGHVIVERERLNLGCHLERFCNRFASAVLLPPASVREAWRESGGDLLRYAAARSTATTTTASLRLGEVGLARVCLFEGRRLRYALPTPPRDLDDVAGLARAARAEGFAMGAPGRAWVLPDDRSRVAVVALAA